MAPSQLKIKVSALNRLLKDESLYHIELQEQHQLISGLEAKINDEAELNKEEMGYELKKQLQVLDETEKMIPQLRLKISEFTENLKTFIEEKESSSFNAIELEEAKKVIENAEKLIS
ncbi:hypothetical protein PACTADRAFT_43869 [Pachysolen tannophilus NRRL Y-2460]|uniref:Tubulin-specific chaperone A n=1 Tax=Pachysolen tannophilus NRRL Y-2460 TaxID=669874 RepID=A0A1E4TSH5_PACTA|nr:hypothetical protein PACTADRAFT_43869 [Pachysolen tannophilus NRRL Y-2460]